MKKVKALNNKVVIKSVEVDCNNDFIVGKVISIGDEVYKVNLGNIVVVKSSIADCFRLNGEWFYFVSEMAIYGQLEDG